MKLLICIPRFSRQEERVNTVKRAVARIAEKLKADVELSWRNDFSVWVYYKNGGDEEYPVYCDWGKDGNVNDVYSAIRSVLFTLSFLPEHAALYAMRND